MSAAIVPASWEPRIDKIFEHVRTLDQKPKTLQKFSKLGSARQHRITSLFPQYPITTCHIVLHKPSIMGGLGEGSADEYAYLIKLILERVSWFARDNTHPLDPNNGKCAVTFSQNGGLSYDRVANYLRWLKIGRGVFNCSIEWNYLVNVEDIRVEPHSNESGLHLADIAASSLGQAVEVGFRVPDDRFIRNIAATLYRRSGRIYGLKYFPKSALERIEEKEHFAFMKLIK